MASYACLAKNCRSVFYAFGGKSSVKPMWECFNLSIKILFIKGELQIAQQSQVLWEILSFYFRLFQQPPEHQLPGEEHISESD